MVEEEGEKKTKKGGRQGDKPQQEAKRHTRLHIHTHRVFVRVCLRGRLREREGERERKGGRVTRRLGEPPPHSSPPLPLFLSSPPLLPSSLSLSVEQACSGIRLGVKEP